MKIVTDCAADLPADEIQALDINVAPLYIRFPEGEFSSTDLTPDGFYDRLKAMAPAIPTTAQPSQGLFADLYRALSKAGEDVLSIHISSGLSGTIQSARLGAQHTPESAVTVVDSMTLSGGQRVQVLAAALAARAGWTRDAILALLDRLRASTEVVFTLETLEYLARGGRIGRVQAIAGTLLNIKPVIHVSKADGKYSTVGKARTVQRGRDLIVDHLAHMFGADKPLWVTVMHGKFAEQAELLAGAIKARLSVARLEMLRISPVLGVHTGPGIVGAVAVPMGLMEGLI
jgi:DegV family protein with EDD domain